jgi:hypothetical protein
MGQFGAGLVVLVDGEGAVEVCLIRGEHHLFADVSWTDEFASGGIPGSSEMVELIGVFADLLPHAETKIASER